MLQRRRGRTPRRRASRQGRRGVLARASNPQSSRRGVGVGGAEDGGGVAGNEVMISSVVGRPGWDALRKALLLWETVVEEGQDCITVKSWIGGVGCVVLRVGDDHERLSLRRQRGQYCSCLFGWHNPIALAGDQ